MQITNQEKSLIQVPADQHPFPLQLEHTALVVVDMQNAFCHPEGFCGCELGADLTAARSIIPRIQSVIAWARQQQLSIVYKWLSGIKYKT
jgi:biuret amidohydrolase